MANSLRDRLMKNSTIKATDVLAKSEFFGEKKIISTDVPIINIACSGRPDGGFSSGVTMIAGPSKHFKTAFSLLMARAFIKKYPNGIILFYDSEFGSPQSYFDRFDVPTDQVVHSPITTLEELRHDITVQLKNLTKEDEIFILIDSLGNVASAKEVKDAESGDEKADMTRAKVQKSLFRIIGPHLTMKQIPLVAINHTYKEQSTHPKDIVSGGTGAYYNANDIWILGRRQDKDDDGLHGYEFIINIEKSRSIREKSKFAVTVNFDEGIYKWSGLFELAEEEGLITSPSKGYFSVKGSDKKVRRSDIEADDAFWESLIKNEEFLQAVEKKYKL